MITDPIVKNERPKIKIIPHKYKLHIENKNLK